MVTVRRAVGSCVLVVAFQACAGSRGSVHVGQPQIHTRERLIAERQSRAEWLRKELAESEKVEPTFQGLRDLRSFSGLYASLKAAVDPAQGDLAEAENDNEKLRLEAEKWRLRKAALEARRDYEEASTNIGGSGTTPAAPAEPAEEDEGAPAPPALPTATAPFSPDVELIKASDAETTRAQVHPLDRFRDRLALRGAVEAEMRTSQFDDSHDVAGGTLYELTLDVSVVPGDWSDEFVEVEVDVALPSREETDLEKYYEPWLLKLRSSMHEEIERTLEELHKEDNAPTQPMRDWLAWYFATRIVPDERAEDDAWTEVLSATDALARDLERIRGFRATQSTPLLFADQKPSREAANSMDPLDPAQWRKSVTRAVVHGYANAFGTTVWIEADGEHVVLSEPPQEDSPAPVGRKEFASRLREAEQRGLQAYSVQPTELVQNISDVSARESVLDLVAAVQVVLAEKGANAEGQFQYLKKVQERLHSILRQPLVVGFSRGRSDCARSAVGWVLGPKFGIRDGEAEFSHVPTRHDVSAEVSVPAWIDSIVLSGSYRWIHARGGAASFTRLWDGETVTVPLPRPDDLYAMCTKAVLEKLPMSDNQFLGAARRPGPVITYPKNDPVSPLTVQAGKSSVLVLGDEVWRSPQVFLGTQRADRVDVLSSMRGLLAHFDELQYPGRSSDPKTDPGIPVRMTVVTTYGNAQVEGIVIEPDQRPKTVLVAKEALLKTTYLVASATPPLRLEFEYARPSAFHRVETRFFLGELAPVLFDAWRFGSATSLVVDTPANVWPGTASTPRVVEVQLTRFDRFDQQPGEVVTPEKKPRLALFPTESDRGFLAPAAQITVTKDNQGRIDVTALRFGIAQPLQGVFDVAYPGLLAAAKDGKVALAVGEPEVLVPLAVVEPAAGRYELAASSAAVLEVFPRLTASAKDFKPARLSYAGGGKPGVPLVSGTTGVQIKFEAQPSGVKARAEREEIRYAPRKVIDEDAYVDLFGTAEDFKANYPGLTDGGKLFLLFKAIPGYLELGYVGLLPGGHRFKLVVPPASVEDLLQRTSSAQEFGVYFGDDKRAVSMDTANKLKFTPRSPVSLALKSTTVMHQEAGPATVLFEIPLAQARDLPVEADSEVELTLSIYATGFARKFSGKFEAVAPYLRLAIPIPPGDEVWQLVTDNDGEVFSINLVAQGTIVPCTAGTVILDKP